jgi:hypothetical protein
VSLIDLQRDFRAHILRGDDAVARHVPEASRRGLPVYAHAYRATLIDCLRDTYEKTALWVGEEAFEAAAGAYIDQHPPSSWTLAAYGPDFAEAFAERHADDLEVVELAWLDRALRQAFAVADTPAIDPTRLAEVDWETATIVLAPHVAARDVRTNAVAIWNALAAGDMPPPPEIMPRAGLLVWRDGLSPSFRTTELVELTALTATLSGKSFAATCTLARHVHDSDPSEIGAILGAWLRDGLIVAID